MYRAIFPRKYSSFVRRKRSLPTSLSFEYVRNDYDVLHLNNFHTDLLLTKH